MIEMKFGFTVDEASEYTGIGRNTIRQLIRWEKLPVLHIGRKMVIRRSVLESFMDKNEGHDLRNRNEITNP